MLQPSICLEMVYEDEPFPDRIDRVTQLGFDTVEFWTWDDKNLTEIEARLEEHDLSLVSMGANRELNRPENLDRAMTNPEKHDKIIDDIEAAIEVADRFDCPNLIAHVGPTLDGPRNKERQHVVECLRRVASAAESAGVTLLLEPLNRVVDHPGYFLEESSTAYEILRDVDSTALGVLFDIYHQQISEGNIISNIRSNVEVIEYFHVADVPGRYEPGTGELNYENILSTIETSGYHGPVGFEFRPQSDSREALETIAELVG